VQGYQNGARTGHPGRSADTQDEGLPTQGPAWRFAEQWDIDGTSLKGGRGCNSGRGPGVADKCLLHSFSWTSHKTRHGLSWYQVLLEQAEAIAAAGFTDVLLPPCCQAQDPQGQPLGSGNQDLGLTVKD